MTQPTAFDIAAEHVRLEEGGLVEHPNDPGGRTNFGITQSTLDAARQLLPLLPATVDELTWDQAKVIYRAHYWQPVRGDEMPVAIGLMLLDCAVNQGVPRAARFLQHAVGVKVDGWIGAKTIAAVRAKPLPTTLTEFAARRAHHYMLQDDIDDDFGLGWARRLFRVYSNAMEEIL